MYKTVIVFLLIMFVSCGKQEPEDMIVNLSGYWEIHKVTMPDGTSKDFSINSTIDFIEVNGKTGLRTKVMPQLDGSFVTTNTAERFTIKIENDSLRLFYQTPFATWKETVLVAKDSTLQVLNHEGKRYIYHKFRKFK
jgi:hypothetical protein